VEHVVVPSALVVAAVNLIAAALGGERWWRVRDPGPFWPMLRVAQTCAVAFAALCGVLALTGRRPDSGLFWLYALLPVAVGVVGEQLRLASAQTVLDARGVGDTTTMATLPDAEQRSIVVAIVRREMGVMVVAALVVALLALRAATTASGL
jgi:hypothetical protein